MEHNSILKKVNDQVPESKYVATLKKYKTELNDDEVKASVENC